MFICRPSSAVGSFAPYLPRSAVTEPFTTYSVTVSCSCSGTERKPRAAWLTPFAVQMFHGLQAEFGENAVPGVTSGPTPRPLLGPPHTAPVAPGSTLSDCWMALFDR